LTLAVVLIERRPKGFFRRLAARRWRSDSAGAGAFLGWFNARDGLVELTNGTVDHPQIGIAGLHD
jgi:hypothetical protein